MCFIAPPPTLVTQKDETMQNAKNPKKIMRLTLIDALSSLQYNIPLSFCLILVLWNLTHGAFFFPSTS